MIVKEAFNLILAIILTIMCFGALVAGMVSAFKGDPAHIWCAYFAASYVFVHQAKDTLEDGQE